MFNFQKSQAGSALVLLLVVLVIGWKANRSDTIDSRLLSQAIVMRGTVERVERAKASGPTEVVFKQPHEARITETLTWESLL